MTELLLLSDSQQLALTVGCACLGFIAVFFARRGAAAIVVSSLCALVPVAVAAAAAVHAAPDYLWMLSPADQARDLVELAAASQARLAVGARDSAVLALFFAACLAWGLSRGAVDRRLGRGARSVVALAAPVVVVAGCATAGILRADADVVAVVVAAAWAGVVVAVAGFSARARVAPDRALLRLGSVTVFAISGLLFVALMARGDTAHDLAVVTALAAVVVAVGGAAAVMAGNPDQHLRGAPRREPIAGLVVVVALFVVVGAGVAVRAGVLPLPLVAWAATAAPAEPAEPMWPTSVDPRLVLEGEGRSPDVILFKDGTYSPVPQNDDDVPAILLDVAADPRPLLLALRSLGHEHALLVGPRRDGSLGGVYVDTADASLAPVAIAHAQ